MSMEYIRYNYGVPAKRGGVVEYMATDGDLLRGVIVGSSCARLRVRLGQNKHSSLFHPTWRLHYLDKDGKILWSAPE